MAGSSTYPLVESIILPNDGIYGVAEPLLFSLRFNSNVFVGQTTPQLPVEIGYRMRHADYLGGTGTNILNFALNVTPGDLDLDGISLGVVDSITGLRDFDFASSVLDVWGNQVGDFIPFFNTNNILVDAKGPEIVSYSDLTLQHNGIESQVVLEINFDQNVHVSGVPLVPVQFGATPAFLTYKLGSGSKSLMFAATVPESMGTSDIGFRKLTGQVIYLPEAANIKDQLGNSIELLGSNYNQILIEDGNKVVVLGAHYEYLETIKREALDQYMEDQKAWYLNGALIDPKKPVEPSNIKSYLRDYEIPPFTPAANDVDLYRIGFRSSIPEQNRFVTAYGIAGIPKTSSESLPVVSWEHQTSFSKKYAASQAFSYKLSDFEYGQTLSTRLKIAHYAGQGYAVISADQFGLGNSTENYAYQVKKSNQQASFDLYSKSLDLIKSLGKSSSDLFLAGWSGGGVTVMGFLEALESKGIKVQGASVAAGPWDQVMLMNSAIFTPRDGSDGNTPDASWLNFLLIYTAFSLSGYNEKASIAEDVLGKYYEAARKLYTGEYKEQKPSADQLGILVDGQYLPNQVGKILPEKYTSDPEAFTKSPYAQLLREASSGNIPLSSDVMMVYGGQDELMSPKLAAILFERQSIGFGKENISLNIVDSANHRAAFLSMMDDSLDWFNAKLLPSVQPISISISSWDQWFLSFVLLGVARGWDSGFLKVLQLVLAMKADMDAF
ncbi:prolyl oligopeptidase family serine peptidase [Synechococcus sp. UW140]|uniref:prolyl oligopeptidase family serine peptidase n=1 Tax=Synechococcus sp. UW140 TaxID=368503 RepID=UPI0031378DAC